MPIKETSRQPPAGPFPARSLRSEIVDMNIESISEGAWSSVIDGTRHVQFEFLAFQLFLVNLRNRLQAREMSIQDCIRELKAFYTKFSRLPMAEKDFARIANTEQAMTSQLLGPEETARRIALGQSLMLAGEEKLLAALPPGNWIGGTIPYFMAAEGGCLCKDKIFVTEIPAEFHAATHRYATAELGGIYHDAEEGDVSFIILPANSPAHTEFALHAPRYADFALHPLVGWIAGIDLAMAGKAEPKVFCGGPEPLADAAAVMRLKLPADRLAQINTINLFEPGDGDTICFPATGFSASTALINGKEQNFAAYLQRINADTQLPLVANYCGAMVNVSLRQVDPREGRVQFYAPVVSGIEYKLAAPLRDYVIEFESRLKALSPQNVLFSCNCVLNYLYSKLEGHRTGPFVGPVTFGEIAFQLFNQTLVFVEIVKVASTDTRRYGAELKVTRLELAAAHEELQAAERRFRALSESAPMGIFLTDPAGRMIFSSQRYKELSGGEDATGPWIQSLHPVDLPGVTAALEKSEREGRNFDREFPCAAPGGKTLWVHIRTCLLRSEKGQMTGRIGIAEDITERKQAEIELERVNQDLLRASREAGIAEITSGVLHNVKNVLNSINVSAGVIVSQVQQSRCGGLEKVAAMMREHAGDLGAFITQDPKGKLLPQYLEQLAQQLSKDRESVLAELKQFQESVQHIKDVVTMQQSYAKMGGTSTTVKPVELMEDALRIVSASLARHNIQLAREYGENLPDITVEKHKVLQILVNLLRNAKDACQASNRPDRKLLLRASNGGQFVRLAVTDNGVGIPQENLGRLFEHGFTTKKEGHGFGLHSCARVVRDLGGELKAHSDGPGTGATFSLTLPISCPAAK